MKPRTIIFLLMIFILAITSPALARSGGRGGGGRSGGSHSGGYSGSHSGVHGGWGGYRGGYYGRGYSWGGAHYYPRAYWGLGLYFGYWGWPYYYPPAYYYPPNYYYPPPDYYSTPPPAYSTPPPDYSTPPPAYSTPPSGEVTQPQAGGGQVFFYPRKNQSQEQLTKDRKECETWAMNQSGVDLTKPPPTDMLEAQQAQKSQEYYRALDACMDGRGYTIR